MRIMAVKAKSNKEREGQPRKLVLYVEDDLNNQKVLTYRIGRTYDLLFAVNDSEACRLLSERGQELLVVLMDIELKDSQLNGLELTKLAKGLLDRSLVPEYARTVPLLQVPIFLVTAYGKKYEADLSACGADGVIMKPVSFASLEEVLAKHGRPKPG